MLAFVHIPKTAGTTLHKIISHQYRQIFIHHDTQGPPDTTLADRIRRASPQVVMGHFSVGLHTVVPEVRYITCLREPVARIVSHYNHAHNDPSHYLHNAIISRKLDLADYVSSGLSGELSNGMTRMIAGVADFHHAVIGNETLAIAKSNIETHFESVILSELFDPGILMLANSLGWQTPYYLRRKVGHYSSPIRKPDESTLAVIMSHNQLDCELYTWAKQRFETSVSSSPNLTEQTFRFQQSNHIKGKAIFCLRELKRRSGRGK